MMTLSDEEKYILEMFKRCSVAQQETILEIAGKLVNRNELEEAESINQSINQSIVKASLPNEPYPA